MPYMSPGVYVEEVPSGNAPIVGAGTSTAAFIGYFKYPTAPAAPKPTVATGGTAGSTSWSYALVVTDAHGQTSAAGTVGTIATGNTKLDESNFNTLSWTKVNDAKEISVYRTAVGSEPKTTGLIARLAGAATSLDDKGLPGDGAVPPPAAVLIPEPVARVTGAPLTPVSLTNFTEFANVFGDLKYLPEHAGHRNLAHAVHGFFLNGGTHCYVVRSDNETEATASSDLDAALAALEPLDDISIVAAPGMVSTTASAALIAHCNVTARDRIAVIDAPEAGTPDGMKPAGTDYSTAVSGTSTYAALYFPWIQVPNPNGTSKLYVPPSGHIAGIYARVDVTRGVHKAPANEPVYGAIGLKTLVSRRQQDLLNPGGVNCIRALNGNILVWGARTLGGDANTEVKYVPVRRLLNFLRASLDKGTQWTVFEPNNEDLWAKVIRNVSAFLRGVHATGALFGKTPEQAFYVKCDAENNPPASRDNGYLNIEIGVAIVRPAEFVVFKISQWAGPQK